MIKEVIKNPDMEGLDKLRLALLFALRYEGDGKVEQLKSMLREQKIQNVDLVDLLTQYAGKEKRKLGLFAEGGGLFERAGKVFGAAFKVSAGVLLTPSRRTYRTCSRSTSR